MHHWDGAWHMGWMGLWWVVIIAAAAFGLWALVAASRRNHESHESPEQALKRRYANGDINRDTYEHMLEDLRK